VSFVFLLFCAFLEWGSSPAVADPVAASQADSSLKNLDRALSEAKARNLSTEDQWLRLMHYQKGWFGFKSDIEGRDFFLSPEGRTQPALELEATLKSLYTAERPALLDTPQFTTEDIHPRCRFPARERWLVERLGLNPAEFAKPNCDLLGKYRRRVNAKAVSLVFSSYYLNSPGSAFGHTLFRIHKNNEPTDPIAGERTELLDTGVGYAAEVSVDNPLLYAIYGLAGFFRGSFTSIPYYFKVREYNDFESRDLWSYELELTDAEIHMLVDHLWELGGTYFRYFFLTQNCAYHLLTALEAAAPRLTLASRLPSLYVIPSDSVKVLQEIPGLIRQVTYRPSIRTRSSSSEAVLSDEEKQEFEKLKESDDPAALTQTRDVSSKARILDAMLDFSDLKYSNDKEAIKGQMRSYKQKWLSSRASLGIPSPKLEIPPPVIERPDLGHGSSRFSAGYGEDSNLGSFTRLQMRFALHDPLDPTLGYPQGSQIEFARVDARFNANNPKVDIERVELFRAMALNPILGPVGAPSWRGGLGAVRSREQTCDGCLGYGFDGGGGLAVSWNSIGPHKAFGFLFAEVDVRYSERYTPSRFRLLGGPTAGLILPLLENLKLQSEVAWRWPWGLDQSGYWMYSGELRWSFIDQWAVSLRRSGVDRSQESVLSGSYYF
jgi:hypothetical protein